MEGAASTAFMRAIENEGCDTEADSDTYKVLDVQYVPHIHFQAFTASTSGAAATSAQNESKWLWIAVGLGSGIAITVLVGGSVHMFRQSGTWHLRQLQNRNPR